MSERQIVTADHVWKRYCRTMRRSVRYAITDSMRSFFGAPPDTSELRPDEFWSLNDVTFSLERGEALAIVGTNGAGKSTLLKILSGVIAPDRGELRVRGRIVSLMMAGVGFHPVLTGRENIFIYGSILGLRRRDIRRRIPAILDFADLAEFLDTPVKYYSTGMYMRLAFSIAAMTEPDVFVVDEVLAVGDAAFRAKCMDRLHAMKRDGCSLLLVSHSAGHLRTIADRGIWLARGECLASGPIESVLDLYLADQEGASREDLGDTTESGAAPTDPAANPSTTAALRAPEVEPFVEIQLAHDAAQPFELRAHESNTVSLRLRGFERTPEPVLSIAFEADGRELAACSMVLGPTLPRLAPDRWLTVRLDLCPRLVARVGEFVVRVGKGEPGEAGAEVRATKRWPCRVVGVTAEGEIADVAAALRWSRERTNAAPAPVVDRGAEVPVSIDDARGATAWCLRDAKNDVVARVPLPPAPADADVLAGSVRAHVPAGRYRQAVEMGGEVRVAAEIEIRDAAECVGHADLDAQGWFEDVAPDADARVVTSRGTLRVSEVRLEGAAAALDGLFGPARLAAEPRASAQWTTALASGERCRLVLRVHTTGVLSDLSLTVGFGHPERGRCAGMRLRRRTLPADTFDVCIDFAAHLARGDYLVGCSATARDAAGEAVELHLPDFARCFVLAPDETGSDGSLEIVELVANERAPAAAPELRNEAAELSGSGLRLLEFSLDGRTGHERAVVPAGEVATIVVGALAATPVPAPSFKFAFVGPSLRCVARMTGFEDRFPFAPLAAGAARDYRMRFRPHLAGGRYQVQVGLMQRSGRNALVTDRRHQGAVCLVPVRLRSTGPALLEGTAIVDVE